MINKNRSYFQIFIFENENKIITKTLYTFLPIFNINNLNITRITITDKIIRIVIRG